MDFHLDTSWCPVCDRQILPKRFLIPVAQHSPPAPAPPPSSPRSISREFFFLSIQTRSMNHLYYKQPNPTRILAVLQKMPLSVPRLAVLFMVQVASSQMVHSS